MGAYSRDWRFIQKVRLLDIPVSGGGGYSGGALIRGRRLTEALRYLSSLRLDVGSVYRKDVHQSRVTFILFQVAFISLES